ncbi:MAG: hypothetical protein KY475_20180 [Planctomycetes bacterium]|nr:hypothetical protein [Planctomycetota bacterium]
MQRTGGYGILVSEAGVRRPLIGFTLFGGATRRLRKQLLIYLPSVLLLILAVLLPQMGRDFVGRMNGREFALFVAFWWTILAAGFHLARWIVRSARRPTEPRGFQVVSRGAGETAGPLTTHCNGPAGRSGPCECDAVARPAGR